MFSAGLCIAAVAKSPWTEFRPHPLTLASSTDPAAAADVSFPPPHETPSLRAKGLLLLDVIAIDKLDPSQAIGRDGDDAPLPLPPLFARPSNE